MRPLIWDVEGFVRVSTMEGNVFPPAGDARMSVQIRDDHSWDVVLKNEDASYSLILRGDRNSRSSVLLIQMLSWLFHQPVDESRY